MLRPATPLEKYVKHPLEALCAVVVWSVFRILPVDAGSAVGGWLGRTIGPHLGLSTRARSNIRRAMPDINDNDVAVIVRDMWDNLGRTVAEFPHMVSFRFDEPKPRVTVSGLEHLEAMRDDGKPGIYLSAHLGNWELAPLTAHVHKVPSLFVYREANNPLVEKLYLAGRRKFADSMVPKGGEGAKKIIRALTDGKHIGLMIDQKMNDGIAVPFFGIEAMTAPALAQMALRFDCPIVPARVVREGGARFRVDVYPPMNVATTGDRTADIERCMVEANKIVEEWVREHPGQWLWLHNRWPG